MNSVLDEEHMYLLYMHLKEWMKGQDYDYDKHLCERSECHED